MLDVILDFLLEPALATLALSAPLFVGLSFALGLWGRRRGEALSLPREVAAVGLGALGSMLALLAAGAGAVRGGSEAIGDLAWLGWFLSWSLAWGLLARHRVRALPASLLLSLAAWAIDATLTEALLFE